MKIIACTLVFLMLISSFCTSAETITLVKKKTGETVSLPVLTEKASKSKKDSSWIGWVLAAVGVILALTNPPPPSTGGGNPPFCPPGPGPGPDPP